MRALCMLGPMEFLKKYLNYIERGGKFIQTDIKNLEQINNNETAIRTSNEEYKFEKTVVASGAFSKLLTDQLERIYLLILKGISCSFKGKDI